MSQQQTTIEHVLRDRGSDALYTVPAAASVSVAVAGTV